MKTVMLRADAVTLDAIAAVVRYYIGEEKADFDSQGAPDDHIYLTLQVVANWLEFEVPAQGQEGL